MTSVLPGDPSDFRNSSFFVSEKTVASIQVIVNGQAQKNTSRFHVVKGTYLKVFYAPTINTLSTFACFSVVC